MTPNALDLACRLITALGENADIGGDEILLQDVRDVFGGLDIAEADRQEVEKRAAHLAGLLQSMAMVANGAIVSCAVAHHGAGTPESVANVRAEVFALVREQAAAADPHGRTWT